MMDLRLTLDFACCHCGQPIAVTVHCSGPTRGKDLTRLFMAVSVPCPDCHGLSRVCFDPYGTVHAAEPSRTPQRTLEPSLN